MEVGLMLKHQAERAAKGKKEDCCGSAQKKDPGGKKNPNTKD